MKLKEIKHPELKNHINMIYMHGENQNKTAINKTEEEIKGYIRNKEFIISIENGKPVRIPYANDGEYLVPIYTDEKEYIIAMDYFSLNDMAENKEYIIEKLDYFKKLKKDPNFLGYIVNIARVSYIINPTLL
ncbi:hypothetical protein SAMN05216439_1896 [Methanobrevibacter gottschalkii]|uniref:Uncharacterized protein n=2 Tax=Methanobrevibacter gottschalkii TaxID=190974 RepID=A0A3N5B113_9EURY|nr:MULTISPECIES: hypothetical protein [Methanobrevibacter]MCQ2970579.1 hypothetical protein [archaeon]OEC96952.1 hypothetical protein A9505_06095 [Methanobrevibacter sp. A27]RPF50957.1 hypothetical protein EDC42_1618 [Methanobrevibacter gottschalkii DSM 11977]SEL07578.1 hypothetical protein SAMN05216439_1896 [Methanobrevibacter gottschalkii]